jgi:hypothetical protein
MKALATLGEVTREDFRWMMGVLRSVALSYQSGDRIMVYWHERRDVLVIEQGGEEVLELGGTELEEALKYLLRQHK